MKKLLMMVLMFLTGCAANGLPTLNADVPEAVTNHTFKTYVGIGIPLIEGSYVNLGDGYCLTAAHNRPILELTFKKAVYNKDSDIAVFTCEPTEQPVKLGHVQNDNVVYHSGYPQPVLPFAYNRGIFVGLATVPRYKDKYGVSTGVTVGGMSGGGTWNSKGELVGITVGFVSAVNFPGYGKVDSPTVFVPLAEEGVSRWLTKVTGNRYL